MLLGLIIAAGAFVRFQGLGEASLWLDETASVQFAGLPWSALWLSGYDNTPPLYYSLLKIVLLFGDSEFALRLPSVVFGVLTIPVIYWAGKLIAGSWAGLAGSLFFAFSAGQLEYSQEARAYSLLAFVLAIALAGLLMSFKQASGGQESVALQNAGRRRKSGLNVYALSILVALYTHNMAVFFVFVAQLAFVYYWLTTAARSLPILKYWLTVNGIVFVLWMPWMYIVLTELSGNGSLAWLGHASALDAFRTWQGVHGFGFFWRGQPWPDVALGLLCLLGAYGLRKNRPILSILLLVSLLAPLLIWWLDLYMERSIVWSFIATPLLAGAGVRALKGRGSMVVLLLLGAVSVRAAMNFNASGATENEDWRAAFKVWQTEIVQRPPGQAALFCSPSVAVAMLYYARHELALPPILAWGQGEKRPNAALLMPAYVVSPDDAPANWLQRIPYDLFVWKRGIADEGRRPVPGLPDDARWHTANWQRLEVIDSHCLQDSQQALRAGLHDRGWVERESAEFEGGHFTSYACRGEGCYLPGVKFGSTVVRSPSLQE